MLSLSPTHIERHPPLAAIHLQIKAAVATVGDRHQKPVLPATDFFHADHVGAEIGEECGAEGSRDVTTEVEHANPL